MFKLIQAIEDLIFTKYSKLIIYLLTASSLLEKNLNIMSLIKDKRMKKYQNLMITKLLMINY